MWLRPSWWENGGPMAWLLLPLSIVFFVLSGVRRWLYRNGLLAVQRFSRPVIVVGNLVAGGSGKTPVVIGLADALQKRGLRVGIVSRGYGGDAVGISAVIASSSSEQVGDEPVLLARRTSVPVYVGRNRAAAVQKLIADHPQVDVIVSDDGLQHYRMSRDMEIIVLNQAMLGNRWMLPAGPLREPIARAATAELIFASDKPDRAVTRQLDGVPIFEIQLSPGRFYRLHNPDERCEANAFQAHRIRAVAGIAQPGKFFELLRSLGLKLHAEQSFPDHHRFSAADLSLGQGEVLLMTEKDAIKCGAIAPVQTWVLPVDIRLPEAALELIVKIILEKRGGSQNA